MESPTPAQQVFQTAELLEQILLGVDNRQTILLSQRVTKFFKNTIGGSSKLQRLIGFMHSDEDDSGGRANQIDPLFYYTNRTFKARFEFSEIPTIIWNPYKALLPGSWQRLRLIQHHQREQLELKIYFDHTRYAFMSFWIGKDWTMGQIMEKLKSTAAHIQRTRMREAPVGASLSSHGHHESELVSEMLYSLRRL